MSKSASQFSLRSLRQMMYSLILVSLLCITGCSPRLYQARSAGRLYPIADSLPTDTSLLAFYRPYKMKLDSQMNDVIALSSSAITRGKPEGRLNNLVTDAMFEVGKQHHLEFDFAHTNYFGLRSPLPAGKLKVFNIFELMPFENYLVTVTLDGQSTLDLFNYMAAGGGDPISGATYKIDNNQAVDIHIGGQPFNINKQYIVLTSDYIANGGDKAEVYKKALKRVESQIKQRDALFEYLKEKNAAGIQVDPKLDGRIIKK
ncbi:5'-nucleotidase C-terminal domain-containing protein [Arcticibacter tournemirensis]|uniref:5'-Nucleotidase C-terminal domain-containing protein n=1 Tax=Arcticibacter tournemirensis TaxID=699437 RepID=A0A4Q0M5C1_9SPHI|nr:5'-nucleotidase [Arcticibacter tournemirensis]RXF67856.1 hypothetical protein EKH83_17550 [Arcticibacter tournemirensis]